MYDRAKANRISFIVVIIAAAAFCLYAAAQMLGEPIAVDEHALRVSSLFGGTVPVEDIRSVEYVGKPAPALTQSWGLSALGLFSEGNYTAEGLGAVRVYLRGHSASCVIVKTDSDVWLLSLGDPVADQNLATRIKTWLK
jgi:hypothetical protein